MNSRLIRVLNLFIKKKCPNVVFSMETKCNKQKIECIRLKLKFDFSLIVESIGSSGGFALLWNATLTVNIVNFSRWYISAEIFEMAQGRLWMLIGFYGHPVTSKRAGSWDHLRGLKLGN